jgi:hypothetical protein
MPPMNEAADCAAKPVDRVQGGAALLGEKAGYSTAMPMQAKFDVDWEMRQRAERALNVRSNALGLAQEIAKSKNGEHGTDQVIERARKYADFMLGENDKAKIEELARLKAQLRRLGQHVDF